MNKASQTNNIWIVNQYASTPEIGIAGRSFYIGRELARLGYNVTVITASYSHFLHKPPHVKSSLTVTPVEKNMRIAWIKVPSYDSAHSVKRVMNWFWFAFSLLNLPKYLSPQQPDIIICSSPSLISWLGVEWIAQRMKSKTIFEMRDIWPLTITEIGNYNPLNPFIIFLKWIEKRAYKNSNLIISNMKFAYEHLATVGISKNKFHWIPNGYCEEEFEISDQDDFRLTIDALKDKFILGYIGTIGTANALHTLVDSAELLQQKNNIHFLIVGNGTLKPKLIEKAKKANLSNITFLNAIPKKNVPAMLKKFDACYIGAAKSSIYKFGAAMNKIAEYFQAARPIIWGIDAGKYRPVSEARCGIEVEPDNAEQLADAIKELSEMDESKRIYIGGNSRIFAESHFNYKKIAKNYANIIDEV